VDFHALSVDGFDDGGLSGGLRGELAGIVESSAVKFPSNYAQTTAGRVLRMTVECHAIGPD
jgi:hypothetical protein